MPRRQFTAPKALKPFNTKLHQELLDEQKKVNHKSGSLMLAKGKHKVMKRRFKGIVSYPQRKILFQVGQNYDK